MALVERTGAARRKTPLAERGRRAVEGPVRPSRAGARAGERAPFVDLAALNDDSLAVDLQNGPAQRLRPVDNEQHRALGRQPAFDQVGEQSTSHRRILRRALTKSQDMLGALRIHAQRDQHAMLVEELRVDEHHPAVHEAPRDDHLVLATPAAAWPHATLARSDRKPAHRRNQPSPSRTGGGPRGASVPGGRQSLARRRIPAWRASRGVRGGHGKAASPDSGHDPGGGEADRGRPYPAEVPGRGRLPGCEAGARGEAPGGRRPLSGSRVASWKAGTSETSPRWREASLLPA